MSQLQQLKMPLLHGENRIANGREKFPVPDDDAQEVNVVENGRCDETEVAVRLNIEENGHSQERERGSDDLCDTEMLGDANRCDVFQSEGALGRVDSRSHLQAQNAYSFLGQPPSLGAMPSMDPFRNHTEQIVGLYEWLKILICLPLAFVRIILALLLTLIGYLLTKLVLLGWKERETPMPRWRYNLMYGTRICARFILFCFGYHWIRRIGKPAKREIAPIVVSNHVSYTDPIFYFYELFPSIVSSNSHDGIAILGTVIRAMQVILVDRLSSESRKVASREIKRKALCNDFPRVMLFPEGTTTNGRSLIFFQLGAFSSGLPVQPVVIRYPHVHFDVSWGKISVVKLIFRMLTQFHNFMEVEFLPVVYPSPMEKSRPLSFARKVRHTMAKALNVVETEYSYGDLVLAVKASEFKLMSASSYMVEMAKMEKLFNISTKEACAYLEKFVMMDSSHSGCLTEDQLLEALDLPKTTFSQKIFGFFDNEEQGIITFREFLAGSTFIAKHQHFGSLSKTSFEFCDFNNRGFLSQLEVEQRLRFAFPCISDLQVHQMLKKLDIGGNEHVSWDDFQLFLKNYPELLVVFLPLMNTHAQ